MQPQATVLKKPPKTTLDVPWVGDLFLRRCNIRSRKGPIRGVLPAFTFRNGYESKNNVPHTVFFPLHATKFAGVVPWSWATGVEDVPCNVEDRTTHGIHFYQSVFADIYGRASLASYPHAPMPSARYHAVPLGTKIPEPVQDSKELSGLASFKTKATISMKITMNLCV